MQDLVSVHCRQREPGLIVIGYFTDNYAPLARALADDCERFGLDYHLRHVIRDGGWSSVTHMQPVVMARSMAEYPGRPIVFMDVDCIIKAQPQINVSADVALPIRVKVDKRRGKQYTFPSSRIIVMRNAHLDKGSSLMSAWHEELARDDLPKSLVGGNEPALMRAIARSGATIQPLDARHSAYEIDEAPEGAVIVHKSAHDMARPSVMRRKAFKAKKRALISRILGKSYREWRYG